MTPEKGLDRLLETTADMYANLNPERQERINKVFGNAIATWDKESLTDRFHTVWHDHKIAWEAFWAVGREYYLQVTNQ